MLVFMNLKNVSNIFNINILFNPFNIDNIDDMTFQVLIPKRKLLTLKSHKLFLKCETLISVKSILSFYKSHLYYICVHAIVVTYDLSAHT